MRMTKILSEQKTVKRVLSFTVIYIYKNIKTLVIHCKMT